MLGLAELVQHLRSEIHDAEAAADDPLTFEVGEIELQLNMVVTREGGMSGKVKFWVLELGGDGKLASASTQQITLKLTPKSGGRKPSIDGTMMRGEGIGPEVKSAPEPSDATAPPREGIGPPSC